MRKYGALSATPDGKAQGHSDKLKPEKLELQQVDEDSDIPNRKLEPHLLLCITLILFETTRQSVARQANSLGSVC